MYKENLFQLIREEEVVIWAGAGLSFYAGFPSGKRLGEIIIESLSKAEKEQLDPSLLLPDLAEEYFRIKGNNKNSLIKILNKTFLDFTPKSTACHDKIASIPHFKTIITTNYDKMFEESLKQKGQLITSSKQIPYIDKNKTNIFKVQGDLSEPESIIITKSDYNNFFKKESQNNVFWSVIKERLSTKSVLFLGYNLEDPNISVVFEKITETLDTHRKECFLVAPNLPKHKESDLIKKGIHYINSTAEELIDDLIKDIKDNIIADLEKGTISADTFRDYLLNNNLLPELKSDKDSYKLNGIKGLNGSIEGKMNLTLKNDKDFIQEFNDFITGKKIGDFEIPEDKLLKLNLSMGGLKMLDSEEGTYKLEIKSTPRISSTIDIRFEDGFEILDIPVKLYGTKLFVEIHLELKTAILKVNINLETLPNTKFTFNYKHNKVCGKTKDEIELFTLLNNLGLGKQFTIFPKSYSSISKSLPPMTELTDEAQYFLEYFENLKRIEQHYNIRFSEISITSINNETDNLVLKVINIIEGNTMTFDWNDELQMELLDFKNSTIEQLEMVNKIHAPVEANNTQEEIVELHGQTINLGFKKVLFLESYVSNLPAIIEKKEKLVRIKSKNNKIEVSYSKKQPKK